MIETFELALVAARRVTRSERTIQRRFSEGAIRGVRRHGRLYVAAADVDRLFAASVVPQEITIEAGEAT